MPNIHSAFPSKYLSAADLGSNQPVVTISHVTTETVGQGQQAASKLIVHFKGKDKGLCLNKTNANAIADILGSEDTDDWTNGKIRLVVAKVDYQGKRVPAIRIDEPGDPTRATHIPAKTEPVVAPDDDDIPF